MTELSLALAASSPALQEESQDITEYCMHLSIIRCAQETDLLDGNKAGKGKPRADDSQAAKNAAAIHAADAAKKRAEALIAEAMSQARSKSYAELGCRYIRAAIQLKVNAYGRCTAYPLTWHRLRLSLNVRHLPQY